jgi:SET domain-containing protein
MYRDDIIENLRHGTYARIQRSHIHGIGVIAIRDIPKRVDPFPGSKAPSFIELDEGALTGIDLEVVRYFKDFLVLRNGKWLVPDFGLNGMDISWYMNHSGNPNVVMFGDILEFLTLREIKKGEELTINYRSCSESIDEWMKDSDGQ